MVPLLKELPGISCVQWEKWWPQHGRYVREDEEEGGIYEVDSDMELEEWIESDSAREEEIVKKAITLE